MTRDEFEYQVSEALQEGQTAPEPTDAEHKLIEYVYMFHPAISETGGKKQIASLYVNFGMSLIRDMKPRAELMEKKERELREARAELERVHDELARIKAEMKEIRAGGEI